MNLIKFDKKCVCGPEYVCVRILDNAEELKIGNIVLSDSSRNNSRLAYCIIENVGWKAAEEYGLAAGDYVLIDRLSTFAHTSPVAILKYNSVIVKTNKEQSEFWPLRNMIFVIPDPKPSISKVNNIYLPSSYDEKLRMGRIVKLNLDEDLKSPFKIGDHVFLSTHADTVEVPGVTFLIYKHEHLLCIVNDDDEQSA